MGTFSVQTTVSHSYYAKKSKDEIIRRIHEMQEALKIDRTPSLVLRAYSNDTLAHKAMALHDQFPED